MIAPEPMAKNDEFDGEEESGTNGKSAANGPAFHVESPIR